MGTPALFLPHGDGAWLPTEAARGPWTPDALHGGPVAALVVREMERALDGVAQGRDTTDHAGFRLARLTLELLKPVPVEPLTLTVRTLRPGGRVRVLAADVAVAGSVVAQGVAQAMRLAEVPLPPAGAPVGSEPAYPGPEAGTPQPLEWPWEAFHNVGMDLRYVSGGWLVPGPAVAWFRLRLPVVPGEVPSGAVRAAAAADFANGISMVLPLEEYLFINPDLTIHLFRPPAGEWVLLDARTRVSNVGAGLAHALLSDARGPVGQSTQTLFVDRRAAR